MSSVQSHTTRLRPHGTTLRTLFLVLLSCVPLFAGQEENATGVTKRAQAVQIQDDRIAIDGRLDEAEWQQAAPADGFVQQQPSEGAPATPEHRSEVRFLYDSENLYIGATFHEDEPGRLVLKVTHLLSF